VPGPPWAGGACAGPQVRSARHRHPGHLPHAPRRRPQVAALRDHLAESRAERGALDHYRGIARQLEEAKARVEEELLGTAQLVTKLEARLREAHGKVGAGGP
jgi:hypothetical protein